MGNLGGATSEAQKEMNKMSKTIDMTNRGMIKESQAFNKQMNQQSAVIRQLAKQTGTSAQRMAADWQDMSTDMRKSLIKNNNEMRKYRSEILEVENSMQKLGSQMGHYTGTTNEFMDEIGKLGKAHKKATDQMINNNVGMRRGLVQTVATLSAMSGQSEKISKNYDQMGNAIYRVNNPLLKVTGGFEKMAREGNAAFVALKQLGPNASMKDLQDRIALINRGIMRMQAVAVVAAVAWVGFTAIMANAALGPDVQENLAAQAEAWAEYEKELKKRTDEIYNTFSLFEQVTIDATNPRRLFLNLQQQVKVMRGWQENLGKLAAKGLDKGFIQELRKMGPAAAGEIAALTQMSDEGLTKYVAMWKEKHALARTSAETELEGLRKVTDQKVKALQDSLTPLGLAWEDFKATWADALAPFVEFWGLLASYVVKAGTKIGELVQKLNDISPWITKIGGMFLYLVTTFTLLLSPLAIGIGLFGGIKAAFSAVFLIIGPLVTGLGAMMGTVLLVSAAVIGFAAALYLLWTRSETFRNAVISGWEAIKSKAREVWGFLEPFINQAIGAVVSFGQEKLAQLRAFWDSEGQQILKAGKNVWNFISGLIKGVLNAIWAVMKFIWPAVLALIKSVWKNIKGVIDGALDVIMGLVKVFSGLFTGDFGKMWEGIKQIFFGAIKFIWNFIQLQMFGKILSAGKLFFTGFKGIITTLWSTASSLFKSGVSKVKNFAVTGFTRMRTLLDDIMTKLKDGISTTFGKIVDAAKALPKKIGDGIKAMGGKAWDGIKSFGTKLKQGFAQIINGATGGINWVMGKLGIDFAIPPWTPSVSGVAMAHAGPGGPQQYARGTNFHPGGPAILGDGGMNELFRTPQGLVGLSPATDTLMNLPKGTQVLSGPDTQKVFNNFYPAYESGNMIGDAIRTGASWLKDKSTSVLEGAKNVVGKVKDFGLDVWSYISNPSKLMSKALELFGFGFPSNIGGAFGEMGRGALSLVKEKVIGFVKNKIANMLPAGGNFGGFTMTSGFGPRRSPGGIGSTMHRGVDFAAPIGTPIPSQTSGIVKYAGYHGLRGNYVKVGTGPFDYIYQHNSRNLVSTGDTVRKGQIIGLVGSTGASTGPHLHYEIRKNGRAINPNSFPGFATGTNGPLQRSQWAWVGERGPELMHLRKGTEVFSHQDSVAMTAGGYEPAVPAPVGGSGHFNPEINITIQGNADEGTVDKMKQMIREEMEEQYAKFNRRMLFNREG
ncbi:peptidoglycan DD-metalloendopeptidase family protein [Indiicoccus explosivorum]|uniref:peptidoglycan DD-metalloendopeptidase family protein n=1 Tax=Indiicoccus explosivorum TaxID=1917864 RepID=UPI00138FE841|nr:peptidoglycan DD-metalloendopeptidase family protein [Indiicoccus explosivorum]